MSAVSWVRRWLLGAPGRNDLERRQAVLLQTILVALLALVAVTSIVTAIMPGLGSAPDAIRGFLIVEPLFLIPLWLLRRGWFTLAASATVLVIEIRPDGQPAPYAFWNAVIWLLGLAFVVWLASNHVPELREFLQKQRLID